MPRQVREFKQDNKNHAIEVIQSPLVRFSLRGTPVPTLRFRVCGTALLLT